LQVDEYGIQKNLETYGIFAATERVLMEAVRNGGDRQELHEVIRQHSMTAWAAMREGKPNPLSALIAADERVTSLVNAAQIPELLRAENHVGDAPERARNLANCIREGVSFA
ncbi:MAG: adenylosuccinate lyase, partial [Anaerolineae bacterium]|nr:adenylosuccinate lyase [Anaerolineae bacterium]